MANDAPSVTEWLQGLQRENAEAAQKLWERYFQQLLRLAERRLGRPRGGLVEAEDVAVSVFESLWHGAQQGRFQRVKNRDELWWLLLRMTQRKISSAIRVENAAKRGGSRRPLSLDDDGGCGYLDLVSADPTPAEAVAMDEELRRALDLLPDQMFKGIAVLVLEGHTTEEISQRLGVATATVTRKRRLIRETWRRDLQQ